MTQFTRPLLFNSTLGQRILRWSKVCFVTLLLATIAAILFPVFASAKMAAKIGGNDENVRKLATGLNMYAYDNDNTFPSARTWGDSIAPNLAKTTLNYHNPFRDDGDYGYGMNADLSGIKIDKVPNPSGTILVYESRSMGRNASSPGASIPSDALIHPGRGGVEVAFVTGEHHFLDTGRLIDAATHPDTFVLKY